MLRQYIEALGRGQPDYDRMTSEVATQTRQQLPQPGHPGRLGALRAMSFRGVTALGSDIYMAHFANGTAEWRISLANDGKVERIALGPAVGRRSAPQEFRITRFSVVAGTGPAMTNSITSA